MKQKLLNNFRLRALMLVAILCAAFTGAWADDTYTIGWGTASGNASTNFETVAGSVDGLLSFSTAKNSSSSTPAYNSSSKELRLYYGSGNGGSITLTPAEGVTITGFVMTTSTAPTVGYSVDGETASNISASNNTYTVSGISASSSLTIQNVNTTNTQLRIKTIEISYTTAGGGSSAVATTTTIDDSDISNTDVYTSTAAGSLSATVKAGEDDVEGASVTWSGNNDEVATIDENTGAVTLVAAGTVTFTATYAGVESEYKASSATYEMTITDSTPIPTHTATFSVNGVTSTQDFEEGADIVFPDDPTGVSGKTFVGWVAEAIDGTTNDAPTFVTSATMNDEDVTFYAVFAYASGSGSTEVTKSYGFETASDPDWTIDGPVMTANDANTGNNAGKINSNNTYVTFNNKVKVTEFSFAFKRTSTNNNYNVYIETSEDNSEWKAAETYAMSSFNNGSYLTKTKEFDGTQELYVRFHCYNTTAVRYVDDVTIKYLEGGVSYSDYCTTVVADSKQDAELSFEVTEVNANIGEQFEAPTLNAAEGFDGTVEYTSSDPSVAQIMDSETGDLMLLKEGTTTITATFAGNDGFRPGYASYTLNVKDNRIATTITQENIVLDVSEVASLTQLNPVVKDADGNEIPYEFSEFLSIVSFEQVSEDDVIASIDCNTGQISLSGNVGTATLKAYYNRFNNNTTYKSSECTFTITVADLNAPGTENNPYTVAQAIDATPASGTSANVYIHGFVSAFLGDDIMSDGSNYRYYVSDDGTTDNQLLVYKGKGLNNVAFSSADDLQIGDEVVILGGLTLYKSAPEVAANNYIVSLVRVEKPAAPTFSVAEGNYTEAQSVELSTTTEGATIYYTIDGTEPTTESTVYNSAIEITETTTIKAIAVKDDVASDVATATYTINTNPSIDLGDNEINAFAEGTDGVIIVTYNNITDVQSDVFFCDADGNAATYGWVDAEINEIGNLVYIIDANESTDARTAYMKVYALDANAENVYSELITINQAGIVVDYATLPFNFDGGYADIEDVDGLTEEGIDSKDYNSSPYLKFNSTSDYLILKLNERPGVLSFDIKGNGFSDGTFKVQTSVNGEEYTDLATYSNEELKSSATTTITYYDFADNIRYIKWVYTEKKTGNVGLGNIKLSKYVDPYTRTVSSIGNYGTICLPNAAIITGAELYTIAGMVSEGNYLSLEKVKNETVAGKPYIFKSTATEIKAYYMIESVEAPITEDNNGLIGSFTKKTITDANGNPEAGMGGNLYVLKNNEICPAGNNVSVGAYKAYIDLDEVSPLGNVPANGVKLFFEGSEDGIEGVTINGNAKEIYDLSGRRVIQPIRGIYIIDGKKVLVK